MQFKIMIKMSTNKAMTKVKITIMAEGTMVGEMEEITEEATTEAAGISDLDQ
jgi:hypothetical protein